MCWSRQDQLFVHMGRHGYITDSHLAQYLGKKKDVYLFTTKYYRGQIHYQKPQNLELHLALELGHFQLCNLPIGQMYDQGV